MLCPHSMSGIEALYWVQQYPEEIEAIIGLDMAVPEAYENYKINMSMLKISQLAARIGITRVLPNISEYQVLWRIGKIFSWIDTWKTKYMVSSDNFTLYGVSGWYLDLFQCKFIADKATD